MRLRVTYMLYAAAQTSRLECEMIPFSGRLIIRIEDSFNAGL